MTRPPIEAYLAIGRCWRGFLLDASTLVYMSDHEGSFQVYQKDLDTGTVRRLTHERDGMRYLAPPCGTRLFYTCDADGDEQAQLHFVDVITRETGPVTRNKDARYAFGGLLPCGQAILATSTARDARYADIVRISLTNGTETILYKAEREGITPAGLSPDGRRFAYTVNISHQVRPLWCLDVDTGHARRLTLEGEAAQYRDVCWKADSSGFYLLTDSDDEFLYAAYYDLGSQTFQSVYKTGWDVDGLALAPDERYLAMLVNEEGYGRLRIWDLVTGAEVPANDQPNAAAFSYLGFSFLPGTHTLVYATWGIRQPGSIWRYEMDDRKWTELIGTSLRGLSTGDLTEPILRRFPSFDGLSVPYLLYQRADVPPDAPVVLTIHGGPEGQALPIYDPLIQYFCRAGYIVVAPNVRGSTGYGKRYHHLDDRDRRLNSIRDVEALLRWLHAEGMAAPDRTGIMGVSYGGYMALLGITEYPDLFAAAVDIAGMSNLETFLENTAAHRRPHREMEYGSLARDRKILRRASPIHRVSRIRCPLMLMHGDRDPRVPVTEAEQLYKALLSQGRPVTLLRYPDEGHGITKYANKLDCYTQMVAFWEAHLKG